MEEKVMKDVSFWRNGAIRIIDKYEGRDVS